MGAWQGKTVESYTFFTLTGDPAHENAARRLRTDRERLPQAAASARGRVSRKAKAPEDGAAGRASVENAGLALVLFPVKAYAIEPRTHFLLRFCAEGMIGQAGENDASLPRGARICCKCAGSTLFALRAKALQSWRA